MSGIKFTIPEEDQNLKPKITVMGIGGAGGNAVSNMVESDLEGCDFVVANTDSQALTQAKAVRRIQLGRLITQGLGAGARPETGADAAEESLEDIKSELEGSHMVFITAGMGGGTGTGAAPVIARVAKEMGILTVGVVTKPFHFEGTRRMRVAESGIEQLQQYVDTLIIIPNQNLFRVANEKTTFADAFKMADDVLHDGVRSVTDLMMVPGLVNLDFADIRTVMSEMGKAMMGAGQASGEKRALEAAEAAIANPLLEDASMKGARAVLINITGGMDMALYEVDEAANRIREEVDPDANIIFGSTFDTTMEGAIRVSVVATGIDAEEMRKPIPKTIKIADAPAVTAPAAVSVAKDNVAAFNLSAPAAAVAATPDLSQDEEALEAVSLGNTVAQPVPVPVLSDTMARETAPIGVQAPGNTASPADLAFMPPKPVTPREADRAGTPPAPGPDTTPHTARRGLFQRIMSGGEEDAAPQQAAVSDDSAKRAVPKPEMQQPELNLTRSTPHIAADPVDRPQLSREDDDMLEIPAFLRRQAN